MAKFFLRYTILVAITLVFMDCKVSLSGISIDPNASTYYIANIQNNALNAPANIEGQFKDALDLKIRQNTRLIFNDLEPDVSFKGNIVSYTVSSVGTQVDQSVDLNRLTIKVYIEYTPLDEKQAWKKNFDFFYDFDPNTDLATIEEEAINTIFNQIIEDIYNKAFTNW